VLLKKYIKLNAKIVGFNVDPMFNNCLDGLILLDVYDVPKTVIESLSKEVNDGSILKRFYWRWRRHNLNYALRNPSLQQIFWGSHERL